MCVNKMKRNQPILTRLWNRQSISIQTQKIVVSNVIVSNSIKGMAVLPPAAKCSLFLLFYLIIKKNVFWSEISKIAGGTPWIDLHEMITGSSNRRRGRFESGGDWRGLPLFFRGASVHGHRRYAYHQRNRSPRHCAIAGRGSIQCRGCAQSRSTARTAWVATPVPGHDS